MEITNNWIPAPFVLRNTRGTVRRNAREIRDEGTNEWVNRNWDTTLFPVYFPEEVNFFETSPIGDKNVARISKLEISKRNWNARDRVQVDVFGIFSRQFASVDGRCYRAICLVLDNIVSRFSDLCGF